MTRNEAIDRVQINIDRLITSSRENAWEAINTDDKKEKEKHIFISARENAVAEGLKMALATIKSINSLKVD